MRIKRLQLANFRNLEDLDLEMDQDFIVLVGPNAAGKTNFLESLYYASLLMAFPPNKSWELISLGQDYFRIVVETDDLKLEYYYGRKNEKRYVRSQSANGVRKKIGEILGNLPTITFLPQDLNLIQQSPGLRREFLDDVLLQTEPRYEETLSKFSKVLAQRNELLNRLRAGPGNESELDFWDEQLSSTAVVVTRARKKLASFMDHNLEKLYLQTTGQPKDLSFRYVSSIEGDTADLKAAFLKQRKRDVLSGRTGIGPHRDDWQIENKEGKNQAHFLSRGEQRSIIISLKLKELEYLTEALNRKPIMLLDELLAELDDKRKAQVLQNLAVDTQVFLTTTNLSEIPKDLADKAQVIELEQD